MNNKLNEPQCDLFEDKFFELLSKYNNITDNIINRCTKESHLFVGGNYGDEPTGYGQMLVRESEQLVYDKKTHSYKWEGGLK